jgi:FtsP/CotA-like multicopper oxidase with cupredoxin domain
MAGDWTRDTAATSEGAIPMEMERRDVLKIGALAAVAAGGLAIPLGERAGANTPTRLPSKNMPKPFVAAFKRPPVLRPYLTGEDAEGPFAKFSVTARQANAAIVPGLTTRVWGYNGIVPGPTISVHQDTRVLLRVRNQLPTVHPLFQHTFDTSTHLHGSASLPQYDGYASDVTHPGQLKEYHYPDYQGGRTLWYHDHAVHKTAQNVYSGLAAQYHLHDDYELAQLPQDEFDVPLVVSDAMFAQNGDLGYDDKALKSLWGDIILVNAVPWPVMQVKRRVYRFRFLNASISRSYRFQLSTGEPMTIVGTDGGMMPAPVPVPSFRQGSAERYEVLIDFSRYTAGTAIDLLNLSNPNNNNFANTNKVMRFQVTDGAFDGRNNVVPTSLDPGPFTRETMTLPTPAKVGTSLRVLHDDVTNVWSINGGTWDDVIASNFTKVVATPTIGEVQQWQIENRSGGWFHPVHIHLVDFRVVWRNTNGGKPYPWELGPKDVVYVGEDETVRVVAKFSVSTGSPGGRYMIHCHNLVHEDNDMMAQFVVGAKPFDFEHDPNDPIEADRPVADTLPSDVPQYA